MRIPDRTPEAMDDGLRFTLHDLASHGQEPSSAVLASRKLCGDLPKYCTLMDDVPWIFPTIEKRRVAKKDVAVRSATRCTWSAPPYQRQMGPPPLRVAPMSL